MAMAGWTLGVSPSEVIAGLGILGARDAALLRAGIILQTQWSAQLNQPGSGQTYDTEFRTINGRVVPVGKAARSHTASAPGEPPAPDTGELKRSIAVARVAGGVRVGSGLRYALALEYGVNVSGSKVSPHPDASFVLQARPHARPALKKAKRKMTKGIRTRLSTVRDFPPLTRRGL